MNKKVIISILVIASIFLVGCSKEDVKNDSPNKTNATQESSNDNDVKKETKTDVKEKTKESNPNSKEPENKSKEIFFGNWVISKHLANDKVQAFSNDDIKTITGKTLSFSNEKATSFTDQVSDLNKLVNNPIYKKNVISKNDFEASTRNYVTFEKLGIKGDNITEITVNDSKNTYCSFYIKDNNTLILSGGGIYLQLNRK